MTKPENPLDANSEFVVADEYQQRFNAIQARVAAAIAASGTPHHGLEFSAYAFDDEDLPVDNLDEVAIAGECRIAQPHDFFEGYWGAGGQDFESEVLRDPTWLQLCVVANRMMDVVKDTHHCYLEGVSPEETPGPGCPRFSFEMGS